MQDMTCTTVHSAPYTFLFADGIGGIGMESGFVASVCSCVDGVHCAAKRSCAVERVMSSSAGPCFVRRFGSARACSVVAYAACLWLISMDLCNTEVPICILCLWWSLSFSGALICRFRGAFFKQFGTIHCGEEISNSCSRALLHTYITKDILLGQRVWFKAYSRKGWHIWWSRLVSTESAEPTPEHVTAHRSLIYLCLEEARNQLPWTW